MKRREFLQYVTLSTASLVFAACSKTVNQAKPVAFGQPEKKDINIGFVPSIECLPLIVAKDKGFFKEQGLTVNLVKFDTWDALKEGLSKGKVDVAEAPFALPLWSHVSKDKSPLIALMGLNLNGGSVGMSKKLWDKGLRPSTKFNYRREYSELYNGYMRGRKNVAKEPDKNKNPDKNKDKNEKDKEKDTSLPIFAIDHPASMSHYLARYWLATMQLAPDRSFKFQVMNEKDLRAGLQSGKVEAYVTEESVQQKLIKEKVGFTSYVNRDIWRGHPDKILTTTAAWAKQNPIGTKAVIASVLAACQFCDLERFRKEEEKSPITLAQQLVKPEYLPGADAQSIKAVLTGNYQYEAIDPKQPIKVPMTDFNIFHYVDKTTYLSEPNHANFLWKSHAVWVLTQMVRWGQLNLAEYPKNAEDLINAAYGMDAYKEVAKAVGLNIPKEASRKETSTAFIDKMIFDPGQPVSYINGFDLRASIETDGDLT
jgi:nitrate/nitrite transport system substrate-binding protein